MHRRVFLQCLLALPLWPLRAARASLGAPATPAPPLEPWRRGPRALERWQRAARQPIVEPGDAVEHRLLAAHRAGQRVRFRYHGGTSPGAVRDVSPGLLFTVADFPQVYLSGYCHTRRAERTFALSGLAFTDELAPIRPHVNELPESR